VRRSRQINFLPSKNVHPLGRRTHSFELRQVRVEVEGFDVPKQAELVKRTIYLDGRWRPVRSGRWPQTEAIIDGYAEPSQQSAREAAETLPRRNAMVAMVAIFGELEFKAILFHRTRGFSDVVMGTNEDHVIGVIEEMPDRLDFRRGCHLIGAQRVEADHYDGINAGERAVERRHCSIISDAFDLNDLMARLRFGLLGKGLEVRFLNVVQKAGDALINMAAIRQTFEFRLKKSAQLENRWKAIFDDREWCTGLCRSAPSEIEKYLSTAHPYLQIERPGSQSAGSETQVAAVTSFRRIARFLTATRSREISRGGDSLAAPKSRRQRK